MPTTLIIIIITFFASVACTCIGGLLGFTIKENSKKVLGFLISFAGGIMLGIVTLDLIPEALSTNGNLDRSKLLLTSLFILIGYIFVYILHFIIEEKGEEHHQIMHDPQSIKGNNIQNKGSNDFINKKKERNFFMSGIIMALTIALHNLPEGIVVGVSYASDNGKIIAGMGFLMTMAVAIHNIPIGMAISVPLSAGGQNKFRTLLITALCSIPTVIGTIIGYSLGSISFRILSILLSFASGGMFFVTFGDLLPEAYSSCKSKITSFGIFLGLLISVIIVNL